MLPWESPSPGEPTGFRVDAAGWAEPLTKITARGCVEVRREPWVRHCDEQPGCRNGRGICLWSVWEARDRAKVEGQVRLLAGTLVFDAEITWRGGGLQSHLERVRIPSASLRKQAPGESRSPAAAGPPSRFGRVCSEHGVHDGLSGGTKALGAQPLPKERSMGSTPSLKVVAKRLTSRRETDDHGIGPGDGSPLPGQPVQTLCGTRIPPERCSGLITARATWRGSSVHRRSNMWLNP